MAASDRLSFSNDPGARERQLRRRAGKAVFPAPRRDVTQADIELARAADAREATQFRDDFLALVKQAMNLPAQAESELLLELKERINALYDSGAGLSGDHSGELAALDRLHDTITGVIRANAGQDALAQSELDREREARTLHREFIRHRLVCDLLRPDSPIEADELAATLLSEDAAEVRAAMALFDSEQRRALLAAARILLDGVSTGGREREDYRESLAVLEQAAAIDRPTH